MFYCYNGGAIDHEETCDGKKDCPCGEDEVEWCESDDDE